MGIGGDETLNRLQIVLSGGVARLAVTVWSAGLLFCWGCGESHRPPQTNAPANVTMVINHDSAATADTLLRVYSSGDNIHRMIIAADSGFSGIGWEDYSPVRELPVPRVEGIVSAFGRFTAAGGATTGVFRDDIHLDLTAVIQRFEVRAPGDTLYPGDCVAFELETGESGSAAVSFGGFIDRLPLMEDSVGLFRGELTIPGGIRDPEAYARGYFTDIVGNRTVVTAERRFVVMGPALNPVRVARIRMDGFENDDVIYYRGFCFISNWYNSLSLFNVNNPASPTGMGTLWMSGWCKGMALKDGWLYVAEGESGLAVLIVEPPEGAHIFERVPVDGQPRDVAVNGDFAYVSCLLAGLKVLNLSNPDNPAEVGALALNNYGERVGVASDMVYVIGTHGIALVDVNDPTTPRLISEFSVTGRPNDAVYFQDHLYIATEEEGVVVYDIANRTQPQRLHTYREYVGASRLEMMAPYLFIGGRSGIRVVAASDPLNFREVGRIDDLGLVRGMTVVGNYLFVCEQSAFTVVNLFNAVN